MGGKVNWMLSTDGNFGISSTWRFSWIQSQLGSAAGALGVAPREMPSARIDVSSLLPKCSPRAPMHAPSCDCVGIGSPAHLAEEGGNTSRV